MALKQIKNKIISTKKTGKVTKAMESVSAVKMRKSQERAFGGRPYVHAALRILKRITDSPEGLAHPLMQKRDAGATLLILVTSDKGLAGSVNSAVLKQAEGVLQTHEAVSVIAIGRKAVEFARREKRELLGEYTNVLDTVTLADVYTIANLVIEQFAGTHFKDVQIIYQNFVSTFEQSPTTRRVLPLDPAEIEFIMSGVKPKTGRFSDVAEAIDAKVSYTVEPSVEEVLNSLVPQLIQIIIYHALLESKASEHSARMVAMKNATDKSKEVIKDLTIIYNKARQAAIAAEVSEITAGVEAMKP